MYDHSYLLAMSSRGLEHLPALRHFAPPKGEIKQLRAFSIWEICQFMLKIPPDTLRKKLADDPTLPQGEVAPDARQRWFTLSEVNELRRRIKYRGRLLLPKRQKGRAIRTAVANFKAGGGKTTVAQHFAHSAALDGYRVLVVDFDPTAALSHAMGVANIQDSHTVWGILCRDLNQQSTVDLPATIRSIGALRAQDFIHKTCWPTIDIIPSSSRSAFAEFALTELRALDPEWQYFAALDRYLNALPEDQYDMILLDCPPSIGQKTLNAFFATDILYVPTGPTYQEFESTSAFLYQLGQATAKLDADFTAIRLLLTKFSQEDPQHIAMRTVYQNSYGPDLAAEPLEWVELLEQTENLRDSVYEIDYRQMTREDWKAARHPFDLAYIEFKDLLMLTWASKLATMNP
jgi:cellulose biosynthesis protein BcsQ